MAFGFSIGPRDRAVMQGAVAAAFPRGSRATNRNGSGYARGWRRCTRGALEILRDFPGLEADERQRFVGTALRSCARLEKGVDELARTVYAAGQRALSASPGDGVPLSAESRFAEHIRFFDDLDIAEIDFAGLEFNSSTTVNDFFDVVENRVEATGRRWYFLVNYGGYSVWPEAWVAFAHRGKRLNVTCSRGTVRYDESDGVEGFRESDPTLLGTREAALARIEQMKLTGPG